MKKALVLAIVPALIAAGAYAAQSVVPGTSYASKELVQHTLSRIYPPMTKNCKIKDAGFGVMQSVIVEEPHKVLVNKKDRYQWSEEWTIAACNKRNTTVVQFLSEKPPEKVTPAPIPVDAKAGTAKPAISKASKRKPVNKK